MIEPGKQTERRTEIGLSGHKPELGWRVLIRPATELTMKTYLLDPDQAHIEFILEWGSHDVFEVFRAEDAYRIGEALMRHSRERRTNE